jgi:site-specific recombinase XerD
MPAINLTAEIIRNLAPKNGHDQSDVYDAKQRGLIVRVNKSGTKTYVALYSRGKRISIGSVDEIPLSLARQKTEELRVAAVKGQLGKDSKPKATSMTYFEYLESVYKSHLLTERKTGNETYQMLCGIFGETFGNMQLSEITFNAIEQWKKKRKLSGVEASTINRNLASFKASFSYAVLCGYIKENPGANVKKLPEVKRKTERYLTEEEEPQFYTVLNKYPIDEFRTKVTLGVRAGARPCEVECLTLADIDLRRQTSCVWFAAAYTKTSTHRFTPLGRLARIVLYLYLRKKFRPLGINIFKTFRRVEPQYQQKIFNNGSLCDNHRKAWATFTKKAGLIKFTPYSLRHDFISKFVMKTGDAYTCAKLVGTSPKMIEKHYGHLAPKFAASRIAALD